MNSINHSTISDLNIHRPTRVTIDLDAIEFNLETLRRIAPDTPVMAVLKANAYGHGLLRVAQLHQELQTEYLAVAFLEEALLLRQNGITLPILTLGGIIGYQIPEFINNNITITASSISKLQQIDEAAESLMTKAKVHLKIDTGMQRIGVQYDNAEKFILTAVRCKNIILEGIFSHFADADNPDLSFANLQIDRFKTVLEIFDRNNITKPRFIHIANSAAVLNLPNARFNMIRPGIILYGVAPNRDLNLNLNAKHKLNLDPDLPADCPSFKPALSWNSRVVYFKVIKTDRSVGYGRTFTPGHNIRAVTVPVGYGDGYFRAMSGKAKVIINDKLYPVIGRISMDQIVINIENNAAFNEDEVILIGNSPNTAISCEDLAEWAGTIPYEILTNINTRVPRIYIRRNAAQKRP